MDEGGEAIVVSNHGGRQLDGVAGSLAALPEMVRAVNGRAEVLRCWWMAVFAAAATSSRRSAFGVRAVLIGRACIYGLAAAGEAGVARVLEILRVDLERTLRLLGCPGISALDALYVDARAL